MFKKFISLSLSFMLLFSCFANAGGDLSLEEIKILLSSPDKYSKDDATVVAMAVLAGLPKYEEIFNTISSLKSELAAKEAALEEMQNARILKEGQHVMYEVKGYKDWELNFSALENHYNYQKANVYEPALEEVRKHRLAALDFPRSKEISAELEAAEKAFAETEKRFKALERQYNGARTALLEANVPETEKALKKEIGILKRKITNKQPEFIESQYRIFESEYETLMMRLREKAGLFLPAETETMVKDLERNLQRFQAASTEEDIAFARESLQKSINKLSQRNVAIQGREMKYYKDALNKFFSSLSKRLSLKSTVPLLAAGGMIVLMVSAQSAQAHTLGFSNKNVIISRQLEYAYIQTPRLMLANILSLSKCYGADAVATVIYENQEYVPLIKQQAETLSYINNIVQEQAAAEEIVISSQSYQLPKYQIPFTF